MFEFTCDKCGTPLLVEDLTTLAREKHKRLMTCTHCHVVIPAEKIIARAKVMAAEMIREALASLNVPCVPDASAARASAQANHPQH